MIGELNKSKNKPKKNILPPFNDKRWIVFQPDGIRDIVRENYKMSFRTIQSGSGLRYDIPLFHANKTVSLRIEKIIGKKVYIKLAWLINSQWSYEELNEVKHIENISIPNNVEQIILYIISDDIGQCYFENIQLEVTNKTTDFDMYTETCKNNHRVQALNLDLKAVKSQLTKSAYKRYVFNFSRHTTKMLDDVMYGINQPLITKHGGVVIQEGEKLDIPIQLDGQSGSIEIDVDLTLESTPITDRTLFDSIGGARWNLDINNNTEIITYRVNNILSITNPSTSILLKGRNRFILKWTPTISELIVNEVSVGSGVNNGNDNTTTICVGRNFINEQFINGTFYSFVVKDRHGRVVFRL